MSAVGFRLVAYLPNGVRLGPLTHPTEWSFSSPLNDLSAATVAYRDGDPGSTWLQTPMEVAVEVSGDGETWTEIPNGRYLRIARESQGVGEDKVRHYTLPSYGAQLTKLRQMVTTGLNADGKRPFLNNNAGQIAKTLIDEAQARSVCPGLTYDFGATTDSDSAAWANVISIYYEPGLNLLTILDNLSKQGMCDWRFSGRGLSVYNPDTVLGQTVPVRLQIGSDIQAMPIKASLEDLVDRVLVLGDDGLRVELTNPSAVAPWGGWEGYISQGGVKDSGTLSFLGQAMLDDGGVERVQFTVELNMDKSNLVPFLDFNPGDYIECVSEDQDYELYRVRQINVNRDAEGKLAVTLILNDRFLEREIRNAKRTNGIVNSASAEGGSGAQPTPISPEGNTQEPAQVIGLGGSSLAYHDNQGETWSQASLTWDAVTQDVLAVAIDAPDYEVWHRAPGETFTQIGTTDLLGMTTSPFVPGVTYDFKVRAISQSGVPGEYSAVYSLLMVDDVTPPEVPSKPVVTEKLAVLQVYWDGKDYVNADQVIDFSHIEVAMGTGASPTNVIGRLAGSGTLTVPGETIGVNKYFRFRSVDRSKPPNVSGWSVVSDVIAPQAIAQVNIADLIQDLDDMVTATEAAQTSADGKNLITYSASAASGSGTAVGDTWFQRNGSGQIIAQWEWDGATWQPRTVESALIANLDAGKITTGYLDADRLNARTIASEKLVIGGLNLIDNGRFENNTTIGWASGDGSVISDASLPGGYALRINGTGGNPEREQTSTSPVEAGDEILLRGRSRRSPTASSIAGLFRAEWLDVGGAPLSTSSVQTASPASNTWYVFEGSATAPAGAAYVRFSVAGNGGSAPSGSTIDFSDLRAHLKAAGELIVDGSITAPKIATDAVQATHIEAGAVEVQHISSGAVSPPKMSMGLDELMSNPMFSDADQRALYTAATGFSYSTSELENGQTHTLKVDVGATEMVLGPRMVVSPGDKFYLSMKAKRVSSANWPLEFSLEPEDSSDNPVSFTPIATDQTDPNNVYVIYEGVLEIPVNGLSMQPTIVKPAGGSVGSWHISHVSLRRAMFSTSEGGQRWEGSPQGFRMWGPSDDGDPSVEIATTGSRAITLKNDADEPVVVLDNAGGVQGKIITANDALYYMGRELTDILEELPRGIIAGTGAFPNTIANVNTEYGLCELSWITPPGLGRFYRLHVINLYFQQYNNRIQIRARVTTDGSQPLISSPLFSEFQTVRVSGSDTVAWSPTFAGGNQLGGLAPGTTVRVLLSIRSMDGGNFAWINSNNPRFLVEDVGYERDLGGIISSGGGSLPGGYVPPASSPPVATYTSNSEGRKWSQSYKGDGTKYTYLEDERMYQGEYLSSNGVLKTAIGSPDQLYTDLNSADTVNWIKVYLYATHWYYNAGGTLRMGVHGYSTETTTFPGVVGDESHGFAKAQGRWITLPSAWHAGFKNGSYRGITMHANGSSDSEYYGYFDAPATRWQWNYTK